MTDDKPGSENAAPQSAHASEPAEPAKAGQASRRPKRSGPTLDLKATEVGATSGETKEPPEAAAETPPRPEPEFEPGTARDFVAQDAARRRAAPPFHAAITEHFSIGALAAGLAGGLLVALLLFVLWLTGTVPIRYAGSTAVRARVAALEMQIHDLSNRPNADGRIDALTQRLDRIEEHLEPLRTASQDAATATQRAAASDNAMKALGVTLGALNTRVDSALERVAAIESAPGKNAAAPDAALAGRIDALERDIANVQRASSQQTSDDKLARRMLLALALRDAVVANAPFAAELAAARANGVDGGAVAVLTPLAANGIAASDSLARELLVLLPALRTAAETTASKDGSFLEKLEANAGKLVRIRPIQDDRSGEPADILTRIEDRARRNDIPGALAGLKSLPPKISAPADAWIAKADLRNTAIAATTALVKDAARALGQP